MHFEELDNTYLLVAIDRIAAALITATGEAMAVTLDPQEKLLPGWNLDVVRMEPTEKDSELHVQAWEVDAWLAYDLRTYPTQTAYNNVYVILPTAFNYLHSHKRLIFAADQTAVPFLLSEMVGISLQYLDRVHGAALQIQLPFQVPLQQEY